MSDRQCKAIGRGVIGTIHDIGEEDGQAYIAMEYLEGETLKLCAELVDQAVYDDEYLAERAQGRRSLFRLSSSAS